MFFCLISLPNYSLPPTTTYTSIGTSGDWKVTSKWDIGTSPSFNQTNGSDVIIIDNNHKITLTDVLSVKSGTVITITANDTLEINGNVTFANGSIINVDTNGVLIINGNITNNNNSNTITINGTIEINGNFDGGVGSEIVGSGDMSITGTVTTSGSGSVFGSTSNCSIPGSCSSTASSPLPINLISFDANLIKNDVWINWKTQTEINNDYFTIERSQDINSWESVKELPGAGNSSTNKSYATIDQNPLTGISYYRLKQTDFNGDYSYSDIRTVTLNSKSEINIYPNPVRDNLIISNLCNECLVNIYSATGQLVYSGNNNSINATDWNKGIYEVIIINGEGIIYLSRIVK